MIDSVRAGERNGQAVLMDAGGSAYDRIMVKRREMKPFAAGAVFALGVVAQPAHATLIKPLPYWASLKANEVYMRVGPGEDYRINWIYHRQHLPLKVLRIMQNWRFVEDPEGARGWIMVNMLVIGHDGYVIGKDPAEMHETADGNSRLLWRLEPGVLGKVGDCAAGWCKFTVNGRAGYVRQGALWGAMELAPGR